MILLIFIHKNGYSIYNTRTLCAFFAILNHATLIEGSFLCVPFIFDNNSHDWAITRCASDAERRKKKDPVDDDYNNKRSNNYYTTVQLDGDGDEKDQTLEIFYQLIAFFL